MSMSVACIWVKRDMGARSMMVAEGNAPRFPYSVQTSKLVRTHILTRTAKLVWWRSSPLPLHSAKLGELRIWHEQPVLW